MAFSGKVSLFHRKNENNLNQSIMQKKTFEGCTVQTLRYSAERQMKASKALDKLRTSVNPLQKDALRAVGNDLLSRSLCWCLNTFVSYQRVETSTPKSTTIIEDFSILREDTFFIGGGGEGLDRGILEFFCEKSRDPPTSWNGLMHDPSERPKQKHLALPPPTHPRQR